MNKMLSGKVGIHNEDREWIKVGVTNYSKDIKLTESYSRSSDGFIRRFTATICGFRNWKLYEGRMIPQTMRLIIDKAKEIRSRIELHDDSIFTENVTIPYQ